MTAKRALLLVGSPREFDRSTSGRLGSHLLAGLEERGFTVEKVHVHTAVRSAEGIEDALAAIARADIVLLFAPLYVDSFAAPVIALLETIAARRVGAGRVRLFSLVQCGFPEGAQNETALAILERFAAEADWEWLGGLAFGGGANRTPLPRQALDLVARAIAAGEPVPDEAFALIDRNPIPAWLYRIVGNWMWQREARRFGASRRLRARPYAN